jgi:hypothetical protein
MFMSVIIIAIGAIAHVVSAGQALSSEVWLSALQQGGYVLVMRHASAPPEAPDSQTANPDNEKLERQLDAAAPAGGFWAIAARFLRTKRRRRR